MGILVSIIIPTYKRSPGIWANAVNSVLNQTYENLEIILVDDNPPGSKYRIKNEEYAESVKSGKIKYIGNKVNLGGALARNEGIKLAKGEYMVFLDDDDEFYPDKIEKQLEFMLENGYDATFSNLAIFSGGKLIDIRTFEEIKSFDNDYLLRYHVSRQITGTPSFMFAADVVREVDGFDKALMGQEFFLMLKVILSGAKIGYFNEYTVKVNRSKDSISFNSSKILGERAIYETKKSYFDRLTAKERRYTIFRHYVISAVAYRRIKKFHMTAAYLILALLRFPLPAFNEISGVIKKKKKLSLWKRQYE